MKRTPWAWVSITGLVAATSCNGSFGILPRHPDSNFRDGEEVRIDMLDLEAMRQYEDSYKAAFKVPLPSLSNQVEESAILSGAAAMIVGYAVKYAQKELSKEATLYEAQFSQAAAKDGFWQQSPAVKTFTTTSQKAIATFNDKWNGETWTEQSRSRTRTETQEVVKSPSLAVTQSYYGIRVARRVGGGDWSTKAPAFELVYGLHPSVDQQMFQVVPLELRIERAKAKVLSDKWFTWILPWAWFSKLIRVPGHEIGIDIALQIDAYWRDAAQVQQIQTVAALETKISAYDLDRKPTLRAGSGLPENGPGWLVGVPVSHGPDGTPVGLGTFVVKATITERDTSNAKQYLEDAAQLIGANEEGIKKLLIKN